MPLNHSFAKALFTLCIIFQLRADSSIKILAAENMHIAALQSALEAQGHRISLLESIVSKQQPESLSISKLVSLNTIKSLVWNNKGKIILGTAGVVALCTLKTLYDKNNEKIERLQTTIDGYQGENRSHLNRLDTRLTHNENNQETILLGINQLRAQSGLGDVLAFKQHEAPPVQLAQLANSSSNNIFNSMVHTIGNSTLSAVSFVARTSASLGMHATRRLFSI